MAVKARLFCLSLSVLMPVAQGCTPELEPASVRNLGNIGTRFLEYIASVDDVNRFHCDCQAKAGDFRSAQECFAMMGGPVLPPLLADCYAEVLDSFPQAREHVECQAARQDKLAGCVKTKGCNADQRACQAAACPDRPYEVEAALAEACLGFTMPPPFECRDGTKILPWLECDFTPNCPDGSDERANCPGAFACKDGKQFISKQWVCDGFEDCGDKSDEANCK